MKTLLALAVALTVVGCVSAPLSATPPPAGSTSPLAAFLQKASDAEIRARAIAQAQEDVRAGTPHVGWCGTIAVYRPNIPPDMERFVGKLPALNLPSGCTNPLAQKGQVFAMAYNAELVKHLPLSSR